MSCAAGCCQSESTPGCTFSSSGRTCIEFACAAGGGNAAGTTPTCLQSPVPPTTPAELTQIWSVNNCPAEFSRILYDAPDGSRTYNPANLAQIQADTNNVMSAYIGMGKDFTSNTSSNLYDPFQDELIAMCNGDSAALPGGCDLFLFNYCQGKTLDQIQSDPVLTSLCGCYIDSSQGIAAVDAAGGRACEPLCHISGVTQQADPVSGVTSRCANTVCVISDVNINLVGTSSTGTTFQQICPSCTPQNPCKCIISGVNVTDTASAINPAGANGVTYQQMCGGTAQCYNTSTSGGAAVPTQCPDPSTLSPPTGGSSWPVTFVIIVFFLILAIALIFLMTRHSTRKDEESAYQGAVAYGESGEAFGPMPAGAKVNSDWTYV